MKALFRSLTLFVAGFVASLPVDVLSEPKVIKPRSRIEYLGVAAAEGGTPTATPTATPVSFTLTENTSAILRNVNIGLQSNQATESETNAAGSNPNGLPASIANWRCNWVDVEPTQGNRNWSCFTDALVKIRADLQTANLRLYETDPGSNVFAPCWVKTGAGLQGWSASHDDSGGAAGTAGCWPDWTDAETRAAYASTVQAMATAVADYPAAQRGITDHPYWGVYNEVNYSGTYFRATPTASAPTPAGGANQPLPTPNPTAVAALIPIQATAFPNVLNVGFPDHVNSTDQTVLAGSGLRGDGWGYRNAVPTQTPVPDGMGSIASNVQMGNLYARSFASDYSTMATPTPGGSTPTPYPTPAYPNLWQTKPIGLETWNNWGTWHSNRWPFKASFDWAVANHASFINNKGQFNPDASWATYLEDFVRSIGYRYYLASGSHEGTIDVSAGDGTLAVTTNWYNRGNAPSYDNFKLLFKLVGQSSGFTYQFQSTDTANWLPGGPHQVVSNVTVPDYLPDELYAIYVAIGDDWPELALANDASDTRWYSTGTTVDVTNSSPTSAPATDYAAQFTNAGSTSLTLADNASISVPSVDFAIAVRVKADTLGGYVIAAKGDVGATGQEWSLFTNGTNSNRFTFRVSTGTNRTVAATTFGIPSTGTWYCVYADFEASTTTLRIRVNQSTADVLDTTGTITDKSNTLVIGGDTVGRYWDGPIDDFYFWKGRRLSTTEQDEVCGADGSIVQLRDMKYETRRGLTVALEMEEDGANYRDDFQHWLFTENGSVTRVSAD